jgi:DNA polymerase III delta subunit
MTKSEEPPPSAILVCGSHEFFVEEAVEEIRERMGFSEDEIERVPDETLAARLPEALASGSLFSSRRLVEADLSPLFGRASPGMLLEEAAAGWEKGTPAGRREAFKKARALLSDLQLENESPEDTATAAAKKVRRAELRDVLAEILRELPEGSAPAQGAASAVLAHLERGVPGTVLLARAIDPPKTSTLYKAFESGGAIHPVAADENEQGRLLAQRARKLAEARGITIASDAIDRLLVRTNGDPRLVASELERILDWAGEKGKISARDVEALVEDRRAEDVYQFFDAFGSRDRTETMRRLERILSGRTLRTGERELKGEDPLRAFLGMIVAEVRRLLVMRARCDETRTKVNAAISFSTYQSGVHPRLSAGTPLLDGKPYVWFKAYQRAGRFSQTELVAALRSCAEADAATKDSASLEDSIAALVGQILGGPGEARR